MADDMIIRRVNILGSRLKQQALDMGLKDEDIVLVKTTIVSGQPPIYELEKIEGNPVEWLQKRFLSDVPTHECEVHKGFSYYGSTCPWCDTDKEKAEYDGGEP